MTRFHLERLPHGFLFVTPDGPDDDLSECLDAAIGRYAGGWATRLQLLRAMLDHEVTPGEDWRQTLLAPHAEIRRRAKAWGAAHAGLTFRPDPNPAWLTVNVDRTKGPVDHYMLAFTTARNFFAELIRAGLRSDPQNPFDRDGWHEAGEEGRWTYCVRRYGKKASYVFEHAGAHFLPASRRPYHRSLFNPVGITARMAAAMRRRVGDHVGTNIIEIMGDDPARFGDMRNCSSLHWPDCGDIIYARSKGRGQIHDRPVVLRPETLASLHRRIDLDHAADPANRPSIEQLKAMWIEGNEDALARFKIFQKAPSRGDGSPTLGSFSELLRKACVAEGVTVGRGSAERYATSRWARREKVDGRMLKAHREAPTMAHLEKANEDLRIEMHWSTDQTHNYGSHAKQQIAIERKRAQHEEDVRRQGARTRGEATTPAMSAAAAAASVHAMRRPAS